MIRVRELTIELSNGSVLLQPTTLSVDRGQIVALQGPSGSGKTTLLRALIGDVPPATITRRGTVEIDGVDPSTLSPADLRAFRRRRAAFVGQDPGSALTPTMTIRRIVGETAVDSNPRAVLEVMRRCLLPTDDGLPARRPRALSGGQQRRVALARAVARRPDVLLLDEPTAGLDPGLREGLAALLRSLADEGLAVLLACHDDDFVADFTDSAVRLSANSVVRDSRPVAPPLDAPNRTSGSVLRGRDIRVAFGEHSVLRGVDIDVPAGSAVGLTGDSGTGKTTLLRVLAGLQPSGAGVVELDGAVLAGSTRARSLTQLRRVQYVPQDPLGALNPARTAGQTVRRPLRLHQIVSRDEEASRVADLLSAVGLDQSFVDRYPDSMSGGQRQRVSLARALAVEPDYLLCDEITSALDAATASGIFDLIDQLRDRFEMGVVIVSHDEHLLDTRTEVALRFDSGSLHPSG